MPPGWRSTSKPSPTDASRGGVPRALAPPGAALLAVAAGGYAGPAGTVRARHRRRQWDRAGDGARARPGGGRPRRLRRGSRRPGGDQPRPRAAWPSGARRARRRLRARCDARLRGEGASRPARGRHPRQQRRRRARRWFSRHVARGLGVGRRHQPLGRDPRLPLLRAADGRAPASRPRRQHRFVGCVPGLPDPACLRHDQVRRLRALGGLAGGAAPARHRRDGRVPGRDQHQHQRPWTGPRPRGVAARARAHDRRVPAQELRPRARRGGNPRGDTDQSRRASGGTRGLGDVDAEAHVAAADAVGGTHAARPLRTRHGAARGRPHLSRVPTGQPMRGVLVSHFHWDREWYRSFEQYRARLVDAVDRVLAILAADPDYRFLLDGQTVLVEDYLAVRPDRRVALAAGLAAGRLAAGPWYVQPDSLLPSGEAHVRNLLAGRRSLAGLAPVSRVGYVPDSFGHPAQLPQILAGFGIETFVYWRGNGGEIDELGPSYRWMAHDGSAVCARLVSGGYFIDDR